MSEPKNVARTAEIRFKIGLNPQDMPVAIEWEATDSPDEAPRDTKSIMLSVWNAEERKAMRVDLWTDAMLIDEMKLFVFQTLVTMADTFERATSEAPMANEMRSFAQRFAEQMGFARESE